MNLFKGGGIYVIEKVVHKVKLTIERILQRQKDWNLHIIDIFTRRRDIATCPLTKHNHLGKCSNVETAYLRSIADFVSALSNFKILVILTMFRYLICLHFL